MTASSAADDARNLVDETTVDVLIVAAMAIELEPVRQRLSDRRVEHGAFRVDLGELEGRRVALVESGPGQGNAVRALEVVSRVFRSSVVMSIGLAGSLANELAVGDIVIANRVLRFTNGDGDQPIELLTNQPADLPRRRHVGTLVTVERAVLREKEKRALAIASQAIAVEMETYAVAEWCIRQKKQLLSVRAISDAVDHTLPSVVGSLVGAHPFEQVGRVVGTALRQPSVVKQLWQLRSRALEAADRLGYEVASITRSLDR